MNLPDFMTSWSAQSPEQLVARASQHLPFWMSLLFVILIGYYLARIAWLLYPVADEVMWTPPPVTSASRATNNTVNQNNPQRIVESHLFGTADPDAAPAAVVEETDDAPDTRLNLKLRATVSAEDPEFAHAIIADGAGEEKVYFIRDSIPGGATLHRVQIDRVILNRGGVLEALRLPKEFAGTVTANTTAARTPTRAAQTAGQRSAQQMLAQNAGELSQVIRPQPYMPSGQMKGYRLFPGRNRAQFMELGLRPGDLVTEINGVALDDPAQGMEIFKSLSDSPQVSLSVQRRGKVIDISIDTSKLAEMAGTNR